MDGDWRKHLTGEDQEKIEPSVVAALYVEHSAPLRRFLLGVLRDSQLASDVLQTTFARLIERGHETREASRKAWLFRVAYNEALATRRRQQVGARAVERAGWGRVRMAGAADEPLMRLESIDAVRRGLCQLPVEQQQIVRMRIYEEKTFAVIAEELGIPLGTALGRMRAAVLKLSSQLRTLDH